MITVKKKTGPVGDFIGGLIFLAAGLAVIYFLSTDATLTCNRDENKCVLQEENLFKAAEVIASFNLSDLQQAQVEESRNAKGHSSYRVMLATHDLRLPLSDVSGRFGSSNKIANKINAYLQSSQKELSVTQSGMLVFILGAVFAAVGGLLVVRTFWKLVRLMLGLILVAAAK